MAKRNFPFVGILGNTSAMRILEYLISLPKFDFNVTELSENAEISRPTADGVIRKFLKWEVIKIKEKRSGITYYQLNEESQLVLSIITFNQAIINKMFPETLGEFRVPQIEEYSPEDLKKLEILVCAGGYQIINKDTAGDFKGIENIEAI